MNTEAQLPGEWDDLIPRLTLEQEATLSRVRHEWRRISRAVGPAARDAAEAGVRLAYMAAGLAPPAHIAWFGSPMHAAIAVAALTGMRPSTDASTDASTRSALEQRARGELAAQGLAAVMGRAGRSVLGRLGPLTWSITRAEVEAQVGRAFWRLVWSHTGGQLWERPGGRGQPPLQDLLEAELALLVGWVGAERLLDLALRGQDAAPWHATVDGLRRVVPGLRGPERLAGLSQVAASVGWWWPFEQIAILTERPSARHHDEQGLLHRADGPALVWPDGFSLHFWHGELVPSEAIGQLVHPSVERIQAQDDWWLAELMMEAYGTARYLRDAGGVRIHRDGTGTLWRAPLPHHERLAMVEVVNTTPEPDGTHRTYWLRVPPHIERARDAVAWTFQIAPADYQPLLES